MNPIFSNPIYLCIAIAKQLCLIIKNFKTMSEEKTYVFDGGSTNGIISALAPMLQNRGIDPSVLALMKDNDGFGGNGGW